MLPERIEEQKALAREKLTAAWEQQVARVQEQLQAGWRERLADLVDERFAALPAIAEQHAEERSRARVEEESPKVRAHAKRQVTERLNQSARRLDQSESGEAWVSALLDGAQEYAARAVVLRITNGRMTVEGARGGDPIGEGVVDIELSEAPAVQGVLESLDTVICLRTASELSPALASALGDGAERRVALAPVLVGRGDERRQVAAVLLAESEGEPLDINVLELLCNLAGTVLDCRLMAQKLKTRAREGEILNIAPAISPAAAEPSPVEAAGSAEAPGAAIAAEDGKRTIEVDVAPSDPEVEIVATPIRVVGATPVTPAEEPPPLTAPAPAPALVWADLPSEEQEMHLKAQRFARVRVAEMRLYLSQRVKEGRAQKRLFQALRGEMERGRAQFRYEFLEVPSMIDYFHQEVVRTLANDDPSLLGPDYPGPLV